MKKLIVFLGGLSLSLSLQATNLSEAKAHVQEANRYFGEKNWEEALNHYEQALQYAPSPQLYFNLGNTQALLNHPGQALYYFLKAKQYAPRWSELNAAIELLYKTHPRLTQQKMQFWHKLFHYFTINTWVFLLCLSFWMSLFAFILYAYFKHKNYWRQMGIYSGCLALLILLILNGNRHHFHTGVALNETPIRFAPTETSPNRQMIPAGMLCEISEQRNAFTYVRTPLGDGWMESAQVAPLYKKSCE